MTTHELTIRVQEHLRNIRAAVKIDPLDTFKLNELKPVARHFHDVYFNRWQDLKVFGIDRVFLRLRGGCLAKGLEQVELKWIFKLETYSPYGLNEKFSFSGFL